jgi:hypothetical protein
MKKTTREFDIILDECLQRLIEGDSLQACLSRYPEHAAALEPLLRTALDTLRAADIRPRPEFRQRAAYQYQMAIREMPVIEKRGFFSVLKPGLATIITVVVVLLAGGGTVAVANNSLPDSPLYQVKLATEAVRLVLAPSALGKAELYAGFADKRVGEIIEMAEKGNSDMVDKATERLNKQLIAVANLNVSGREESAMLGQTASEAARAPAAAEEAPKALMAPAPTAAPTTTTPTMTATPVPAPVPDGTPPPQITLAPTEEYEPPVTVASPAPASIPEAGSSDIFATDSAAGTGAKSDKQEKLRQELSRQYLQNRQALEDELEKAPESLKPALLRAIEIAEKAYLEALASLD